MTREGTVLIVDDNRSILAALRLLLTPQVPFSCYIGPLSVLWPLAFGLLLLSYVSDCLLWREEWDP